MSRKVKYIRPASEVFMLWYIAFVFALPFMIVAGLIVSYDIYLRNNHSLPEEERYQYVNVVAEDLDYESLGVVVSEERKTGEGHYGNTQLYVKMSGENVYAKVQEKVRSLPYMNCGVNKCSWGKISLFFEPYPSQDPNAINFKVIDPYNGESDPRIPKKGYQGLK